MNETGDDGRVTMEQYGTVGMSLGLGGWEVGVVQEGCPQSSSCLVHTVHCSSTKYKQQRFIRSGTDKGRWPGWEGSTRADLNQRGSLRLRPIFQRIQGWAFHALSVEDTAQARASRQTGLVSPD